MLYFQPRGNEDKIKLWANDNTYGLDEVVLILLGHDFVGKLRYQLWTFIPPTKLSITNFLEPRWLIQKKVKNIFLEVNGYKQNDEKKSQYFRFYFITLSQNERKGKKLRAYSAIWAKWLKLNVTKKQKNGFIPHYLCHKRTE